MAFVTIMLMAVAMQIWGTQINKGDMEMGRVAKITWVMKAVAMATDLLHNKVLT